MNKLDYIKSKSITALPDKKLSTTIAMDIVNATDNSHTYRQALGQKLVNHIASKFGIETVRLKVVNTPYPHKTTDKGTFGGGKLGHYRHIGRKGIEISIWNKTAMRGQVTSNKNFYGTLLHEICHMLDCQYFDITSSPHTDGFYKRITSLKEYLGA